MNMQPARPMPPMYAPPPVQNNTIWENPTDRDYVLDLHVGATRDNPSGKVRYIVSSKGQLAIPSHFDRAIHDVRDGIIVGGLGPQLRRRGVEEILHPSLDEMEAKHKLAVAEAQKAIREKAAAEEALALAQAQLVERSSRLEAPKHDTSKKKE